MATTDLVVQEISITCDICGKKGKLKVSLEVVVNNLPRDKTKPYKDPCEVKSVTLPDGWSMRSPYEYHCDVCNYLA